MSSPNAPTIGGNLVSSAIDMFPPKDIYKVQISVKLGFSGNLACVQC